MIDEKKLIEEVNITTEYGFYGEFIDGSEVAYTLRELMQIIESQPPAEQWIPCSSGSMPEDGQTVVVTIKSTDAYRFMVVLTYHETKPNRFTDNDWQGEGFYHYIWGDWIKRENVIAWMPAEPYKGE